jgi:hypothetical protein
VLYSVFLMITLSARAQFSSAIDGTVKDVSGAAVQGATMTLTAVDTGIVQVTKSNDGGYYRFSSLAPGMYELAVNAQGFQQVVQKNIQIIAGGVQGVPFTIRPATGSVSIQVTDAPPLVQTEQPSVSNLINRQQVEELPLQGRNFINAIVQAPGIVGRGAMGNSGLDIFISNQGPSMGTNGQPMSANVTYLDGTFLSDSSNGGFVKLIPNPDSIQEMVISTTNYSAQFGMGGGANAQLVSRSGTNSFHGSIYEYHEDNALTARTEFQNVPNPATGRLLPVFRRNEFGGSVGGPIYKNKTFFFFTYDQLRSTNANAYLTTVETPEFVNFMEAKYPNNVSTSLLKQYPAAVGPLTNIQTVAALSAGCSGLGPLGMPCDLPLLGTGTHSFTIPRNGTQWNLRIDHNFSASDKIYGNYYQTNVTGFVDLARPAWNNSGPDNSQFAALSWIHTVSPTVVLESGFGATHSTYHTTCPNCQVPDINVTGMYGFGTQGTAFAQGYADADTHWRELLSLVRGKHSFKAGFEMFHDQNFAKFTPNDARPTYTALSVFDFAADAPEFQAITFDPTTGGIANGNRYWLRSQYAAFAEDNWKIAPNLSLSAGLRWEFPSNPSEAHGNRSNLVLGAGSNLKEQITNAFVKKDRNAFSEERLAYFAPRLGLAWQPGGLTDLSVRAGFGIFFNRGGDTIWGDTAFNNPPIAASITASVLVPAGPQPVFGLCKSDTLPYDCARPPLPVGLNERGGSIAGLSDIGGPDLTLRQAYAEDWFLGVQKSFGQYWMIEADYMGSNGIHLYSIVNRNRFAGDRVIHGGSVTRLNPFFGAINYADNSNQSAYNGGDVAVQRKFSRGVSFQAAYTFGKAIDLMGGAPGCNRCSENDGVVDAYNLRGQRGISEGDVSKQLSFNALWQIPIKQTWGPVEKGIFGGWQISGIGVLTAGAPQSVYSSTADYNGDGNYYDFPNAPAFGRSKKGLSRSDYLNGVFAASQFPSPCPGSDPCGIGGNLGRDPYRGPGFAQVDTAFAKNNRIPWFLPDGAQLQFRGELFNAFNRVNLGSWDTNLSDGLFGKATTASQARTAQLSLRITF